MTKPEKKYYDIKVQALVPTTISYRVLAESPEQAVELIKNHQPRNIKYNINIKRLIKAVVYDVGTIMIRLTKKF